MRPNTKNSPLAVLGQSWADGEGIFPEAFLVGVSGRRVWDSKSHLDRNAERLAVAMHMRYSSLRIRAILDGMQPGRYDIPSSLV